MRKQFWKMKYMGTEERETGSNERKWSVNKRSNANKSKESYHYRCSLSTPEAKIQIFLSWELNKKNYKGGILNI